MKKSAIRYIVDDVDEAIDFYAELLGFSVRMHQPAGFAALQKNGLQLFLNQPGAGGAGQAMPDGESPSPGGWNRLQLTVDDLDSFYSDLKEKGATFRNEITEGKGGKQVLLQDPSGNLIELFEPAGSKSVQPIPDGFHTVTPYILAEDALGLIEFIKEAFDGEIEYMSKMDDGTVQHSTVRIGDSPVMISSGNEKFKPNACMLHLYVEDVDKIYKQAVKAGGQSLREPTDEFYGDRSAGVKDNWGNQWWIATHVKDVSDEEMKSAKK